MNVFLVSKRLVIPGTNYNKSHLGSIALSVNKSKSLSSCHFQYDLLPQTCLHNVLCALVLCCKHSSGSAEP